MADPVTIGIGIAGLIGGAFVAKKVFGGGGNNDAPAAAAAPAAAPAPLPPDPSTPAQAAPSKPAAKRSQQQSFLSGAAQLQQAGAGATGGTTGKSLLGQ